MSKLGVFIRSSDTLVSFIASVDGRDHDQHEIAVTMEELQEQWNEVKTLYREFESRDDGGTSTSVDSKFASTRSAYISCIGRLRSVAANFAPVTSAPPRVTPLHESSHGMQLPPCDTPVFGGDYLSWPTFRDLFTAIYINNSRLSNVERLFHLLKKTSGYAKNIVEKAPLTNAGFTLAWQNLSHNYENKRLLVNSQLKILFQLEAVRSECASALHSLQNGINNCIAAITLSDVNTDNWDPILVFLCSQRLPEATLALWEQSLVDKTSIPTWNTLNEFLTNRFQTLESIGDVKSVTPPSSSPNISKKISVNGQGDRTRVYSHHSNNATPFCVLCPQRQHKLYSCKKFIEHTVHDRISMVKQHNLCFNCLQKGHSMRDCKSSKNCSKCSMRHHSLLHRPKVSPSGNAVEPLPGTSSANIDIQSTSSESPLPLTGLSSFSQGKSVLLGTAMVHLHHRGSTFVARALIDSASEASFVSARLKNLLQLPVRSSHARISGLNQKVTATPSKACHFELGSPIDPNFRVTATAFVLPHITGNLPSACCDVSLRNQLPNIVLADSQFFASSPIDVLIGGDLYPHVLLQGVKKNIGGSLLGQETVFGWILTGSPSVPTVSCFVTGVSFAADLSHDKQLQRFWELEELPKRKFSDVDDKFCEDLFTRTTTRTRDGRYVVSLPFKDAISSENHLGTSRSIAYKQFCRTEKTLIRKPDTKAIYDKVLTEYMTLDHMERVHSPSSGATPSHCYLPHHPVLKPSSTTTALRVVFNASSATANGVSLNDILHVGPVLQADLTWLLLKWRLYRFVFNSDIEKMYRQIWVHPTHRPYQRIVFRKSADQPIIDYQLKTVTFGVNCAPYLAIRTLLQLANDVEKSHPLATKILRTCMYVDDVLAGFHQLADAMASRDQLREALHSAGFPLRKWTANDVHILKDIPKEHLLHTDFMEIDSNSSTKALGIRWNAKGDFFYFVAEPFPVKTEYTKREVLSTTAKLFDPAGWLSPIVIAAKIIMQQIWVDGTDWDETITSSTLQSWLEFLKFYHMINLLKVPRWVCYSPQSEVEIHAFSDASEKAYAGVIYIRVVTQNGVESNLFMAKTKVAPVKTISIPRLELCGAVLLADMIDSLLNETELRVDKIFCWTDSTIVLAWIQKPPSSWTTFVANRVSKIQEKIGIQCWSHVATHENPADFGSRGASPSELHDNSLWWHGPSWLKKNRNLWPISPAVSGDVTLESKKIRAHSTQVCVVEDILDRFSSLPRALRVLSYVFRFLRKTRPLKNIPVVAESLVISSIEISNVTNFLVILCQRQYFSGEYQALESKRLLNPKSNLLTLNPFLDSFGLMRVNGRLVNSSALSYNERYPILLPYHCRFTKLLCQFIHLLSLHGGNQLVTRLIRQQYWIPKVKNLVKHIITQCKTCIMHKSKGHSQMMAALPPERTELSRPFTNTGIDYAGPFDIKTYAGRGCRMSKGYVCVFVCFATKALHLEATTDLTSETFLAAFTRFVSRRGCPHKIFSDNGTNFVGASKILRLERQKFLLSTRDHIVQHYGHQNLSWKFIPAGAPHMGGLWEAGVKSFKAHFQKIASTHKYTFEELNTLLCRIEACLNSRPLSPMSTDVSDTTALTPGHFLIGTPLLTPAEPCIADSSVSLLHRWRKLKVLSQQICLRWKEEYLKELHKRTKWKLPSKNLSIGDLVVVRQENLPTTEWRLGRVLSVFPGTDHKVRVADIQTQRGVIRRPVVKLVLLPDGASN